MMIIKLKAFPENKKPLSVFKSGEHLVINGQAFDLSVIPDGATLRDAEIATGCWYFMDNIERINGEIHLTLKMPIDYPNSTYEQRFPEPIHVTEDGEVQLP